MATHPRSQTQQLMQLQNHHPAHTAATQSTNPTLLVIGCLSAMLPSFNCVGGNTSYCCSSNPVSRFVPRHRLLPGSSSPRSIRHLGLVGVLRQQHLQGVQEKTKGILCVVVMRAERSFCYLFKPYPLLTPLPHVGCLM